MRDGTSMLRLYLAKTKMPEINQNISSMGPSTYIRYIRSAMEGLFPLNDSPQFHKFKGAQIFRQPNNLVY